MKTYFKLIPNLLFFGIAALIVFAAGYNGTVDALIATFIWLLIVGGAVHIAGIAHHISVEDLEKLKAYQAEREPLWWTIPKSFLWLGVLAYADWTITAVAYFILQGFAFATRKAVNDKVIECEKRMGDSGKPLELSR